MINVLFSFKIKERHYNVRYAKQIKDLDLGSCKYCTNNVVKDENHLRIFFNDLRVDLHAQAKHIKVNFENLSDE